MIAIRATLTNKDNTTFTIKTPDNYSLSLNYSLPGDILIGDTVIVEGIIINMNVFKVIRVLKGDDIND